MNVEERKKALRRQFSAARKALTPMEHLVLDGAICSRIAGLAEFAEAATVVAYASDGFEVNVRSIIEMALRLGKTVAMPRYDVAKKVYELAQITVFERDMVPGKYGLLEPSSDLPIADLSEKTLWLIPAVAFDKNGTRLGRGGGFYDRMLENAPGKRVGVFYHCQFSSETLPQAEHDQILTMAVTEKECINF